MGANQEDSKVVKPPKAFEVLGMAIPETQNPWKSNACSELPLGSTSL